MPLKGATETSCRLSRNQSPAAIPIPSVAGVRRNRYGG